MADSEVNQNQRVWRIANMSPWARSRLDGEKYRLLLETDDVTPETIQQELFMCLLDDLKEIGIYLTCQPIDIYGNTYDFDLTLNLLEWILPNEFYKKLQDDKKLQGLLTNLLTGGVSNDMFITTYLEFLGGHDNRPGYRPELEEASQFLLDKFRSDGLFITFMSTMMAKLDEERLKGMEAHGSLDYMGIITRRCQDIREALGIIGPAFSSEGDDVYNAIFTRVDVGIRYLLAAGRITLAGWLFTTPIDRVTSDCKDLYRRKHREFYQGWKLSAAYFNARGQELTKVDIAGIMCMYYATCGKDKGVLEHHATILENLVDDSLKGLVRATLGTLIDGLEELYDTVREQSADH